MVNDNTAAPFVQKKRSHLQAVQTPRQRQKLNDEIDEKVRRLVRNDEDGLALAFLIDVVSGIYQVQFSLGNDRSSDLPSSERQQCALRILDQSFISSCSHTDAMIAWLGLEDAKQAEDKRVKPKAVRKVSNG